MGAGVISALASPNTQPRMATGSYTGNGTTQDITMNFQPDYVTVENAASGATSYRCYRMAWPGTGSHYQTNGAALTYDAASGITSLNANGFTVSSSAWVNTGGATFYWVATKAGG